MAFCQKEKFEDIPLFYSKSYRNNVYLENIF